MMAFEWSSIPWWAWVLLVVAAVIVAPLKMKILKRMMGGNKDRDQIIEDE